MSKEIVDPSHIRLKKEFKSILKSTGEKLSREQEALLDIFCSSEKHLTVSELGEGLRKAGIKLNDEAIEETLKLFCDYGIAEKKAFEDRGTFYEHRHLGKQHDHFVCVKCGRIIEISNGRVKALQEKSAYEHGFRPIQHKLEIYGYCDECAGKLQKVFPLLNASVGEHVRVVRVIGGHGVRQRLADLGLLPGAKLEVIHVMGPFVVGVKGSRVALGRGVVQKIVVEPVESRK